MGQRSTDQYTSQTISAYDPSPPPDDGTQVAANLATWASVKDELADPIKTLAEAINTTVDSAFGSVPSLDDNVLNQFTGTIGFGQSELTIASGAVAPTRSRHLVDTEADAASDDLDTLTPGSNYEGTIVILSAANTARTVQLTHQTGSAGTGRLNLFDNQAFNLDDTDKIIALELRADSDWYELFRSVDTSAIGDRGHIGGLTLSNGTDTAHDIDIAVGEARDSTNAQKMSLDTAITKQIDATFVAGTDAGGLSSSLTAPANSTWYHVHLIVVSGNVDVGFDTSVTAANLVTDHSATAFRRIGSVLTDGSANIIGFNQIGERFTWDDPPQDINDSSQSSTAITRTLTVPTGVNVLAECNFRINHASAFAHIYIRETAANDEATGSSTAPEASLSTAGASGGVQIAKISNLMTDTSAQVTTRGNTTSIEVTEATLGWVDWRGKFD